MEFGKSCCFTGHRPAKLPWGYNENDPMCVGFKEKLCSVVEAVCESGVTHFICGMALRNVTARPITVRTHLLPISWMQRGEIKIFAQPIGAAAICR